MPDRRRRSFRRDGFAHDQTNNRLGTFTYNSLADLEAGRPASFTRQLAPRLRSGAQTVATLSLGDSYRRTPRLQFQYGLRLDAHQFANGPAENPLVEQTFGVANDAAPARAYLSPRLGFSWGYGTASQVAGFEGAQRGPRATIRGGAGVFQNTPQATLLGTAVDNTGLPSTVQQLACVGPAAPAPDWAAYDNDPGAVPDRCADGSTGTVFANRAPDVTLFARDWRAARSVRSNLSWSGPVLGNRLAAKQAYLDSTRTAMERRMADTSGRVTMTAGPGGNAVRVGPGGGGPPMGEGGGQMMIVMAGPTPPARGGGPGAPPADALPARPAMEFVTASELPDYKPPFAAGAARADADGRAWVRLIPTTPMPGPVYAVVDRAGRLVDRVLLPAGASIAGFGPGGVVYFATRDAAGVQLQRARVR